MYVKRISNDNLKMIILALAFLEPPFISLMPDLIWEVFHMAFYGIRVLAIVIGLISFIGKQKADSFLGVLICFFSYMVVNDLVHQTSGMIKTCFFALSVLSMVFLVRYFSIKGELEQFLRIVCFVLGVYIIINYLCIYIAPQGLARSSIYNMAGIGGDGHFFGYKNRHIYYFIPYTAIKYLIKKTKTDDKIFGIMHFCIIHTLIMIKASTATIIYSIVLMALLFPSLVCKVKSSLVILCSVICSILLILTGTLVDVSGYIAGLFMKGNSLSGRVTVWKRGVQMLLTNPVWGTGLGQKPININYQQYHNKYLDLWCSGGVFLCILFLIVLFYFCRMVDSYSSKTKMAGMLTALGYGILFVMEAERTELLFWVVITSIYYYKGSSDLERKNKKIRIGFKKE